MTRWIAASAALVAVSCTAQLAQADTTVGFELGATVAYMIAGGSNGAAATGGALLGLRGSVELRWEGPVSLWYAQQPSVLNPSATAGFVDLNDLGIAVSTEGRAWRFVVGGSVAPAWLVWCNREWCLRSVAALGGGIVAIKASPTQGLVFEVSGRAMYAQPSAWHWPGIPAVTPVMGTVAGGASWEW